MTLSFAQFVKQRYQGDALAIVADADAQLRQLAARAQLQWGFSKDYIALDGELLEKPDIQGKTKEDTARSAIFSTLRRRTIKGEQFHLPFIRFVNHRRSIKNQQWDSYTFLKQQYQRFCNGETLAAVTLFGDDEIIKRQNAAKKRRYEVEKSKKKAIARDRSLFFNSYQKAPHNFATLTKKHLEGLSNVFDLRYGVSAQGEFICYPLYSDKGIFRGLQRIYADGTKKNTYGLVKNNAYNVIGSLPAQADNSYRRTIFISESMANCATIYKATGCPSVIATDAGNIKHISARIRAKYPNAPIVIVADNDAFKARAGNTGVMEASKAAAACGAWVCVPDLSACDPRLALTDINDLYVYCGLKVVRDQLRATTRDPINQIIHSVEGKFNLLANNPKFNIHPKLAA
jgi:putative DNA primase/helicase